MLKKVLIALDGSRNAERALPWVKRLAAREKALVLLCRVLPAHGDREHWTAEEEEVRGYLGCLERELNYAGIPSKILIRRGRPAQEIVRAAQREGGDLILMTTRGASKVKRWVMGGVTEQVLRLSPIPVLPVQSRVPLPRQGRVRRIIVPVDGSELADAAVNWGLRMARLLRSKLIFLHVFSDRPGIQGRGNPKSVQALFERFSSFAELLSREGLPAAFRLMRGDPASGIIKFAGGDDLIVTSTHGYGGFRRWIFGSVAEKLIHQARTPVLVFKSLPRAETA